MTEPHSCFTIDLETLPRRSCKEVKFLLNLLKDAKVSEQLGDRAVHLVIVAADDAATWNLARGCGQLLGDDKSVFRLHSRGNTNRARVVMKDFNTASQGINWLFVTADNAEVFNLLRPVDMVVQIGLPDLLDEPPKWTGNVDYLFGFLILTDSLCRVNEFRTRQSLKSRWPFEPYPNQVEGSQRLINPE